MDSSSYQHLLSLIVVFQFVTASKLNCVVCLLLSGRKSHKNDDDDEDDFDDDDDDDDLLHLEESDSEPLDDEDIGPVLQVKSFLFQASLKKIVLN